MKKVLFFVVMMAALVMTSCRDFDFEPASESKTGNNYGVGLPDPVHDSTTVTITIDHYQWPNVEWEYHFGDVDSNAYRYDTINGTVIIEVYRDTTTHKDEPRIDYTLYLGSNMVNRGSSYRDPQPAGARSTEGYNLLETTEIRSAELVKVNNHPYLSKVPMLTAEVGYPTTDSEADIDGSYDVQRNTAKFDVRSNDGYQVKLNTSAEAKSGKIDKKDVQLLSRQVYGADVVSMKDEATGETVEKDGKVYGENVRTTEVVVRQVQRPLAGVQILTNDTLSLKDTVYVETGTVVPVDPQDTIPVDPHDTIPVDPKDTIPVNPQDTVTPTPTPTPDEGYTINGEKVEWAYAGWTVTTSGVFAKYVLVGTAHYVEGYVNNKKQFTNRVANPKKYNSVAWSNGKWQPAKLVSGTAWYVDSNEGTGDLSVAAASCTDFTFNAIYGNSPSNYRPSSKSELTRKATLKNEGKTTRVSVGSELWIILK